MTPEERPGACGHYLGLPSQCWTCQAMRDLGIRWTDEDEDADG